MEAIEKQIEADTAVLETLQLEKRIKMNTKKEAELKLEREKEKLNKLEKKIKMNDKKEAEEKLEKERETYSENKETLSGPEEIESCENQSGSWTYSEVD